MEKLDLQRKHFPAGRLAGSAGAEGPAPGVAGGRRGDPPRRLIFIDETGTSTAMARRYGRAPPVRDRGCLAFDGATDAATFQAYVEQAPAPPLRSGDIVLLENLAAHRGDEVERLIR
jgi:hypothetical protein